MAKNTMLQAARARAAQRRAGRADRRAAHKATRASRMATRSGTGNLKPHERQFIAWLDKTHPQVAKRTAEELARSHVMGDLGDDLFSKITDTIQKVVPSLAQAKAQKKVIDLQLSRAKQGLPPLDAAQYSPGVQVQVQPPAMSDTTKAALWVGGGILTAAVVKSLMGGKKAA